MFGSIGGPELILILAIALLIFGPKKLPEVGKSIGKAMREFRKTSDEIKEKIEEEIQADEFKEIKKDIDDNIKDIKSGFSLEDDPPAEDLEQEPQTDPKKDTDGETEEEEIS